MAPTFGELAEINRQVTAAFDARERRRLTLEIVLIELAKQVGDLARVALTTENYYLENRDRKPGYLAGTDRFANELADILHCFMRVADHYGIDLADAHVRARTAEWHDVRPDDPVPWVHTSERRTRIRAEGDRLDRHLGFWTHP